MISLLLTLFSLFTWAQSCPEKNLLTIKDSPFNHIPIYDQDGSGTCYAYAASQMANFYIMSKNKSNSLVVHPLAAALAYQNYFNRYSINAGSIHIALEQVGKYPICSYFNIKNAMYQMATKFKMNEHQLIGYIETFHLEKARHYKKIQESNEKINKENDQFSKMIAAQDNTYLSRPNTTQYDQITANFLAAQSTKAAFKNHTSCSPESLSELGDLIMLYNSISDSEVFKDILLSQCSPENLRPLPAQYNNPKFFTAPTDLEYQTKIRNTFKNHNQPIGISYCSSLLYYPKKDYIIGGDSQNSKRLGNQASCGGHASVLVGSRNNGGKCEYLLRNSWGSGHGSWTTNFSCDCRNKKTKEYIKGCNKVKHPATTFDVVGCWIPEESISKNTFALSWLE